MDPIAADVAANDPLAKIQELEEELRQARRLLAAAAERDAGGERYSALFAATQEGLLIVNDDGCYVDVNDAYARLLKSTREEVIGRHFSDFMPPGRLGEAEAAFASLKTTGQGLNEFPLRAVDGSLVECEWTLRAHFLPGLSLCSAREVTARKMSEEALRMSEARFRLLAQLDDATRPLTSPEEIAKVAAGLLGEQLNADGLVYCQFAPDQESITVTAEYTRGSVASLLGHWALSQFGSTLGESLRSNQSFTVEDIETDPRSVDSRAAFGQLGIRAYIVTPSHKNGRLSAAMAVYQMSPRKWTEEEQELVQLVSNRCRETIGRVQAEAELRRQSDAFNALLSNLPDMVCNFGLDGRLTYANPALLRAWRKPLAAVEGKNALELLGPPEFAHQVQAEIQSVIRSLEPVRNYARFTAPTGETLVFEYICSPVLAADGSLEAVTCAARDVTERERMKEELSASQQRLQQILTQAPVAIVVLQGRDLVVELVNPSFRDLLQRRQLIGRPLLQAIPELGKEVLDPLYRVLETGEPFSAADLRIAYDQRGDGRIEDHWFNVAYHPFRDPDESVSRVIVVCSEVTRQVLARHDLERANRELEEFAYVASHDLQEPLRMVGIYTELLLSRQLQNDPVAQQYGVFVRQGVERMERLIHDLLDYSRIIHADGPASGCADLNESLTKALKTLENRIAEQKARVIAARLPLVAGEASQLEHVFQNLLSNSLKYRSPERAPEIRIGAARNGDRWIVSVEDNGIGFDQQYAQRVFGLFKRLHKDDYLGTGLGLAICQRILERYGGRIWAEAEPGKGATFHFSLPAAENS